MVRFLPGRNASIRVKKDTSLRWVIWPVMIVGTLCCINGCTEKSVVGDTILVSYNFNARFIAVGLTLAALSFGVYRFSQKNFLQGISGVLVAFLLGVVAIPMFFWDHATLTPARLKVRHFGIGIEEPVNVIFEQVSSAVLTTEGSSGNRGRDDVSHYLVLQMKNGDYNKILVTTLLQPMLDEIKKVLSDQGIEATDLTGE